MLVLPKAITFLIKGVFYSSSKENSKTIILVNKLLTVTKVIIIDRLEFDIKRALATSPRTQLQWHVIRDELYKKYDKDYEAEDTFSTILHRKLKKLMLSGDIDKREKGHMAVFYFIPRKRLRKIREELDRELAHRRFDDIWKSFSPEQRKRELKNLLQQRAQQTLVLQNITKELSTFAKEQVKDLISRLENPTENMKTKHSSDDRKQLLEQAHGLAEEINAINLSVSKIKINENELKAYLNLIRDFLDKIVQPKYSGNWNRAITDLMRKAIEEQNKAREEKAK